MPRTGQDKEIHDQMVRTRVSDLKSEGYSVKADIDDYDTPGLVGGSMPDIVATNHHEKIIVEVETCDSYYLEHTKEQFESFSSESGAKFHAVVPIKCIEQAKAKAIEWGIKVDQWWEYSEVWIVLSLE